METPNLIVEWNGANPTSGMCSVCRAIFPAVEWNGPEANGRLLERTFQEHVKTEHSGSTSPVGKGARQPTTERPRL